MLQQAETMGSAENTAGLFVRFNKIPKEDSQKSAVEGRPVFTEVDYITIAVPGDKTSEVCRPATPDDKARFRTAWERYVAGQGEVMVGTPLREWPGVTRAQVEELAYFKVYTVEQLAEVSDGNLRSMGPLLALRQRARDFLERVRSAAPVEKMRQELEERDKKIADLMARMDALTASQGEAKRGPGRPRKEKVPEAETVTESAPAEPGNE